VKKIEGIVRMPLFLDRQCFVKVESKVEGQISIVKFEILLNYTKT